MKITVTDVAQDGITRLLLDIPQSSIDQLGVCLNEDLDVFVELGQTNRYDMSRMRRFFDEILAESLANSESRLLSDVAPRHAQLLEWVERYKRDYDWQHDCVGGEWTWDGLALSTVDGGGFRIGSMEGAAAGGGG
jgi:hypothetical protein